MLSCCENDLKMIFANVEIDYWHRLKHKTIFLTGGTGFFGIWLVMSFLYVNRKLDLKAKLIILTRNREKFLQKHVWLKEFVELEYLEGDIIDFKFIKTPVDYIIHAATEASSKLNIEQPLLMFDTIVKGTKRVLEFAKSKQIESFLLTSSGAVYGKQPPEIENISEDYNGAPITTDPQAMYGEGKRMSELLCSIYNRHANIPIKIARCYTFVGPFLPLDAHFAVGNFIKNLIEGKEIVVEGDGTPIRSYMYISDLIVWLWNILFKGENNSPYNVGSDQSVSIGQLAGLISQGEVSINIKKTASSSLPLRYVPCIKRARSTLKLDIYTDLRTSLDKTIAFNRTNHKFL